MREPASHRTTFRGNTTGREPFLESVPKACGAGFQPARAAEKHEARPVGNRPHRLLEQTLNAVERLAKEYGPACTSTRRDLDVYENQLRDYKARLGKPFTHECYLFDLAAFRDQLKVSLSATPREGEPTPAELPEQIKTLRASQTIEAVPQRTAKRKSSAQEPVTSVIRRRAEEVVDSADEV